MSSGFWTEKSYIPYQSHNFKVDFNLYAIKADKFYQQDDNSIMKIPSTDIIQNDDVEDITIPAHAVKSIDMPTLESSVSDVSANLSSVNETEARDPNYQDIVITFYAVDTDHGNIIDLLPRIFHAYYLNWIDGRSQIPFLTQFDKDAPAPNQGYVGNSSINVKLFKGTVESASIQENPKGDAFRKHPNRSIRYPHAGAREESNIVYRSILPVSYDIGNLSYAESGVIECTMVFKYNLQDGKYGTKAGSTNKSFEPLDEPAN